MQLPLTVLPLGVLKLQLSPDLAVLQALSASAGGPWRPPLAPSLGCAIEAEQANKAPIAAIEAKARAPVKLAERRFDEMERMIEIFLEVEGLGMDAS